jgi:hypothetical protein
MGGLHDFQRFLTTGSPPRLRYDGRVHKLAQSGTNWAFGKSKRGVRAAVEGEGRESES